MVISYYGSLDEVNLSSATSFLDIKALAVNKPIDDLPTSEETDLISKLSISEYSMSSNKIRSEVASQRKKYDLIAIEPKSAGLAAFAVRDNRVDLVRINPSAGLSVFNKKYGNRLLEYDTLVEIDLSFYFRRHIASVLRPVLRILETFSTLDLNYHLTNSPSRKKHLRSYRGLQSLGRLLGLSDNRTKRSHLINRIKRNRKKLDGDIPFPGVEIDGSEK